MFIKSLIRKNKKRITRRFHVNFNHGYKKTVFLAGTGRSGTTWISDIINFNNKYRYIFEPFHPLKVHVCRTFRYRQYLRDKNNDKEFIDPVRNILSGRIRNKWTDNYNEKFFVQKHLIKDIRANLFLKWLHENFPGISIILILRHPCAVANSKIKLNWDTHLEEFLEQEDLIEDFLHPFIRDIERAKEVFDKHIFQWCIENYVPLKQFQENEIHLAFYENFCINPEDEIKRLFSFLGIPYNQKVFKRLKTPSMQTRTESAIATGKNLIDNWRKDITDYQVQRAIEILNIFGLDRIYTKNPTPRISSIPS